MYNGHELSQLDHCLLWITLATLVYPTVDSGLTIRYSILLREKMKICPKWTTHVRFSRSLHIIRYRG